MAPAASSPSQGPSSPVPDLYTSTGVETGADIGVGVEVGAEEIGIELGLEIEVGIELGALSSLARLCPASLASWRFPNGMRVADHLASAVVLGSVSGGGLSLDTPSRQRCSGLCSCLVVVSEAHVSPSQAA